MLEVAGACWTWPCRVVVGEFAKFTQLQMTEHSAAKQDGAVTVADVHQWGHRWWIAHMMTAIQFVGVFNHRAADDTPASCRWLAHVTRLCGSYDLVYGLDHKCAEDVAVSQPSCVLQTQCRSLHLVIDHLSSGYFVSGPPTPFLGERYKFVTFEWWMWMTSTPSMSFTVIEHHRMFVW